MHHLHAMRANKDVEDKTSFSKHASAPAVASTFDSQILVSSVPDQVHRIIVLVFRLILIHIIEIVAATALF